MNRHKQVLTRVDVEDPITGETGTQQISYENGVCEDGMCLGFVNLASETWAGDASGPRPGTASRTEASYHMVRDYQVPQNSTVLMQQPGGAPGDWATVAHTQSIYETGSGLDPVRYARLTRRVVDEYGENPSSDSRSWTVQMEHNDQGLITQVEHIPDSEDDEKDYVREETQWVSNPKDQIYVMSDRKQFGWDQDENRIKKVEHIKVWYDNNVSRDQDPSNGWVTRQRACSGPVGDLCESRVQWDYTHTDRGAVDHIIGRDSNGTVFSESTTTAFAWGDTVAAEVQNALGHTTTQRVDAWGQVDEETDVNGIRTRRTLDAFGRAWEESIKADGGPDTVVRTRNFIEYDPLTNSAARLREEHHDWDDSHFTLGLMNGHGDPVRSIRPHPEGGTLVSDTLTDVFGNTLKVYSPGNDPSAPLFTSGFVQREQVYDVMGRIRWMKSATTSGAMVTEYPRPGISVVTDAAGYRKRIKTDTHGRVVKVREGRNALVRTGKYRYDGKGRLSFFKDAEGTRHKYRYDGAGRLREVRRAEEGGSFQPFAAYHYNGPHLIASRNGAGRLEGTWDYDEMGRKVAKSTFNEATGAYDAYTWTWDTDGTDTWLGGLFQTEDPAGSTSYGYDENAAPWGRMGRVTSTTRRLPLFHTDKIIFQREFDFKGRPVEVTWPSGAIQHNDYALTGERILSGVEIPGGTGRIFQYQYDQRGWLVNQRDNEGNDLSWRRSPGGTMLETSYNNNHKIVYDRRLPNGWIREKTILPFMGDGSLQYSYDNLGRASQLDFLNGPGPQMVERYAYSDAGRLMEYDSQSPEGLWTYEPQGFNQVESRTNGGGQTELYDWDDVTGVLRWNTDTELGVVSYQYDGDRRLVEVASNHGLTQLYYDVDDNLVFEDRAGNQIARFQGYRADTSTIVEQITENIRLVTDVATNDRTILTAMQDIDGHAVFLFDGIEHYRTQVTGLYGKEVHETTGTVQWNEGDPWDLDGMHSSEPDLLNEVTNFGVRHAMHRDGIWMQPDPLLELGMIDPRMPLAYGPMLAAGNPVMHLDPTGAEPYAVEVFYGMAEAGFDATVGAVTALPRLGIEHGPAQAMAMAGQGAVSGVVDQSRDVARGAIGVATDPRATFLTGLAFAKENPRAVGRWVVETGGAMAGAGVGGGAGTVTRGAQVAAGSRRVTGQLAKAANPCNCFVAGTGVLVVGGTRKVNEIREGDRVITAADTGVDEPVQVRWGDGSTGNDVGDSKVPERTLWVEAAASTDGGEEVWVKVASDADVKSAAWSPRGVCSRIAKAGRKAVLPAMLAACDPASAAVELPSDLAVVQVYDARTGAWEKGLVGELEVGDEVLHDGHLLRVTDEGVEDRGFAEVGQLSEADATWTVDGVRSVPDGVDWVLALGDDVDAGHWRLQDLVVGERFAFGGRVFESAVVDGELAVRPTGDVLGRVYQTHVRKSDVVIDLVVAGPDGDETITGTPEHPFWVEAAGDYVAMGDLEVGTVLRTTSGDETRVAGLAWREGDFEVFNFEVEGVHNYFVSAPGVGNDGVLVHNGCGPSFKKTPVGDTAGWRATEPGVQSGAKIDSMKGELPGNQSMLQKTDHNAITTTEIDGNTYILNGHHRVEAANGVPGLKGDVTHRNIPASDLADSPHTYFNSADEVLDAAGDL